MTLDFSREDKIKALRAIGYVIKHESVELPKGVHPITYIETHSVINVYWKGSEVANFMGLGDSRLNFVFKQELSKRLLKLF